MQKPLLTIFLLILSNIFMTLAWYGHLKFKEMDFFKTLSLWSIILISWGLAFFEYIFQVPANKIGYEGNGGPFNLWQLKVVQEFIHLAIFTLFAIFVFKTESLKINHIIGFLFLILAVYLLFKK